MLLFLAIEVDQTTGIIVIVVVLLIAAVILGLRSRKLGVKFKAPGVSGELKSEADAARAKAGAMSLKDIKGGRDVRAHSGTGGDVNAEKIRANQDVTITSNNPSDKPDSAEDETPKA